MLDVASPLRDDEFAVQVDHLNVDSASWAQLRSETGGHPEAMAGRIREIVDRAGKMHNPVTGSGGMLLGTVSEVGAHRTHPRVGDRIASLVSLTLTPLTIDDIVELDPASEKVGVKGRAILFGSSIYAGVPDDLDEQVVLGVLDVCGAPAWMARLADAGMRVVIIGAGGKSGVLATAQAIRSTAPGGEVLGLCWPEETVVAAEAAGAHAVAVDCTDPIAVAEVVAGALDGGAADIVFVCSNVAGCEGGALLAAEDEGRVVFFSMGTSFTTAALTAEGLGRSCEMIIGNGFVPGHAELALDLIRQEPQLAEYFV